MATIKYLITQKKDRQWGIITNTVGLQDIAPGSSYPVGEHPENHLFFPKGGRVLQEAQIVYIVKGGGWFVSAHQHRTQLRAGDAVVLYPHEWHSYAPNPDTGWSEAWIGFAGDFANTLLDKFFPDKSKPIHHIGVTANLLSIYEQAYEVAESQLPAYQQQLAGHVGLIVSTVYARSQQLPFLGNPDINNINFAIKHMRQHLNDKIRMEDVAAKADMGYSKFRKMFKDYTGFAPTQYFLNLKLEKAKDYLSNTRISCKEIAFRLGFDSAAYFIKMFRQRHGITPMEYRSLFEYE